MPITKSVSSRSNAKQLTGADVPQNPTNIVTNKYTAVSTSSQTIINLSFAVDQANKNNFVLIVNGKVLSEGASNDFTFTSVQPNNTSSQVTLTVAISSGLNIIALNLGIAQSNYSLASLTSSVTANTNNIGRNALLNGAFDHWQRLLTTGTTTIGGINNGTSAYGPDRWYAKNSLGTNGVLQFDQTTGAIQGSTFGASLKISTAPTAAQANGCELYQVLENANSIEFYGQIASFSAYIKALGNVNQVGIQLYYATTEVKLTTAIGSETLVAVNSSTFTLGSLVNQAVGTAQTTAGVIGVRIRITGVSTGNTYDINNGFVVEQAMLSKTATAINFSRQNANYGNELLALRRYFWRTGSSTPVGCGHFSTTTQVKAIIMFPVKMRAAPTPAFSNATTGATFSRPGSSNTASSVLTFIGTVPEGTFLGDANDTGSPTTAGAASTAGFPTVVTATTYFQADAEI